MAKGVQTIWFDPHLAVSYMLLQSRLP
jgi:hypothetical protein